MTPVSTRSPARPAKWRCWPLAGTCNACDAPYGHVPSGPRNAVSTRCMTGSGGVRSFGRRGGGCVATGARPATRTYKPAHLFATVMRHLFDVGQLRLRTDVNRDIKNAIENTDVIEELFP